MIRSYQIKFKIFNTKSGTKNNDVTWYVPGNVYGVDWADARVATAYYSAAHAAVYDHSVRLQHVHSQYGPSTVLYEQYGKCWVLKQYGICLEFYKTVRNVLRVLLNSTERAVFNKTVRNVLCSIKQYGKCWMFYENVMKWVWSWWLWLNKMI